MDQLIDQEHTCSQFRQMDEPFGHGDIDTAFVQVPLDDVRIGNLEIQVDARIEPPVAGQEFGQEVDANRRAGPDRLSAPAQATEFRQRKLRLGGQVHDALRIASEQFTEPAGQRPADSDAAESGPWIAPYAFVTAGLFCLTPYATPGLALGLGIGLALSVGNPWPKPIKRSTRVVLQVSVVLLGFGMDLSAVLAAARQGFLLAAATILLTFVLGALLRRALRLKRSTTILLSAGTAICGGSAIAAVALAIDAAEAEVSVALGTVFTLNAVALYLFPPLGHWLGLSQIQFGTWSGIAIHDLSSVVGAASAYGQVALQTATAVKAVAHALDHAGRPAGGAAGLPGRNRARKGLAWKSLGALVCRAVPASFAGQHVAARRPPGSADAAGSGQDRDDAGSPVDRLRSVCSRAAWSRYPTLLSTASPCGLSSALSRSAPCSGWALLPATDRCRRPGSAWGHNTVIVRTCPPGGIWARIREVGQHGWAAHVTQRSASGGHVR